MDGNIPILNPLANEAAGDADGDQLSNLAEFQGGTNPQEIDTDRDGFTDYAETSTVIPPTGQACPYPTPTFPNG